MIGGEECSPCLVDLNASKSAVTFDSKSGFDLV